MGVEENPISSILKAYLSAPENESVSQSSLARALGLSPAAVNKWYNGSDKPSRENLAKLAQVTGIPVELWLGMEAPSPAFDRLELSDCLKKQGKTPAWLADAIGVEAQSVAEWLSGKSVPILEHIVSMAQAVGVDTNRLTGKVDPDRAGDVAWIPLFGSVQAGPNGDWGDHVQIVDGEWSRGGYNVPESLIRRRRRGSAVGCVIVEGDSMEPFLLEGDIVLVEVARSWKDARKGDTVVVDVTGDGEYVIKRLMGLGKDSKNKFLVSNNGKYDPIIVRAAMRIFGVVVAIHRPMI